MGGRGRRRRISAMMQDKVESSRKDKQNDDPGKNAKAFVLRLF
jgi:hypothetical protein